MHSIFEEGKRPGREHRHNLEHTSTMRSFAEGARQHLFAFIPFLLTILKGFEWEPKENNGVEEAIQTMNPENLRENRNP